MVDYVIQDWQGQAAGNISVELRTAKEESAAAIVHRALIRQLANARQGNHSSKTRSEVRGGGRKPWKQKGTGRARAGSIRSPLWRGGGVIFGPKPRDYSVKMNRKERRLALRTALLSRSAETTVVQEFAAEISRPKTKDIVAALERWGVEAGVKVLLITAERDQNVELSVRNLPNVKLITATNLNIFDLLNADRIVSTSAALEKIQEVYGG